MYLTKHYRDLRRDELYGIFYLRQQVFTVEQKVTCSDITLEDKEAVHFFEKEGDLVIGYLRLFVDSNVKFQRFCVAKAHRGGGRGRRLLVAALDYAKEHFPGKRIEMSAQVYLKKFYLSMGFAIEGEEYEEGGINHIKMYYKS